MKTATKVFLIISMVLSLIASLGIIGINCATVSALQKASGIQNALSIGCSCSSIGSTIIFAIIALIPGIICYMAYVAIENATLKSEIITISIVTLILGSPIAGILMLCIPESKL